MQINRRTQLERSAATRAKLIAAGRTLFVKGAYPAISIAEIANEAGVTRGAFYHHFADKGALFVSVFETVESEAMERLDRMVESLRASDPMNAMRVAASSWLDACVETDFYEIGLREAPAVMSWNQWRDIGARYGTGLVERLLAQAMELGAIPPQPVSPLANIMLGALREGAMYMVSAHDQRQARIDVGAAIDRLILSLGAE